MTEEKQPTPEEKTKARKAPGTNSINVKINDIRESLDTIRAYAENLIPGLRLNNHQVIKYGLDIAAKAISKPE